MARPSMSAMIAVTDVNHGRAYPPALRYHIDVAMNPNTFFETLRNFHSSMGTRFVNPMIGGEKLDLHHLYFLVTQWGGIEKAILDGKWREIIAGLNIPQTITNRSFVVKKHYFKFLFHYEQVYYFRRQGPIVTPPVSVRQRSCHRFQFVNNSGQAMPLLPQPVFNQGFESPGYVPHHLPLGESQPEDVEPLPDDEEGDDVAESDPVPAAPDSVESSGELPFDPALGMDARNGHTASGDLPFDPALGMDARNGHAASGDLPSDPTLGMDAPNVVQSAPSSLAANADAGPNFVALSPSFRENAPIDAQSFPTNMAAHDIGENMPDGGGSMHNNLVTVNIGSPISHGVLQSQPLPAANSSFSFSAPSTAAEHPQPCWSAYSLFFEEKFSMFRNLSSESMGKFFRLIEESWGRLTEAERGVYTDRERMDRERYERELNEYQERIRRTQSK